VLASLWTGPEIKPEELLEGRRQDTAPSEETIAEVEANVDVSNVERPD
jgi:hypothetical protein